MAKTASDRPETEYILGHSDRGIRRLMHQAAILRPITEGLPRGAGIGRGGAGDVSMLAAELVGAAGSVVGIDRNQDVIAVARERAQAAKLGQVVFEEVSSAPGPESNPLPGGQSRKGSRA